MAVTALPSPKTRTAPRGGSKAASPGDVVKKRLTRLQNAVKKAEAKTGVMIGHAVTSLEIQAGAFGASFASGYMRGKGKDLKVWGVDMRLGAAGAGLVAGMFLPESIGTHTMAVSNGVMASLVAETAFDLGVKAAAGKGEAATETAGVWDDDDDDDVESMAGRSSHRSSRGQPLLEDSEDDELGFILPTLAAASGLAAAAAPLAASAALGNKRVRERLAAGARRVAGRGRNAGAKVQKRVKGGGKGKGGKGGKRPVQGRRQGPRPGHGGRRPAQAAREDRAPLHHQEDWSDQSEGVTDNGEFFSFDDQDWTDDGSELDAMVSSLSADDLAQMAGIDGDVGEDGPLSDEDIH